MRVWNGKRTTRDNLDYMSNSFRPRYGEVKDILLDSTKMSVRQVKNSSFDMITDTKNTRNKAVRLAEKMFKEIQKDLPETFKMPPIAVVDFEKQGLNANAIGGYHEHTGILLINSKYDTKQKILDFVNKSRGYFANTTVYAPYLHELGHKYYYDSIKKLASKENISYNKAKRSVDNAIATYIDNNYKKELKNEVSEYAYIGYVSGQYTEVIAECFSTEYVNILARDIIKEIKEMG